ncbi:MAG: hypothetical protein MUF54_05520 [Polyangiaceae bacterium]|jgi:hypothetical protein|nr:hypothetical protein [Polyangiaceae bacterium]
MPEQMSGGSRDDEDLTPDLPPIDDDPDGDSIEEADDRDVASQFEALEAEASAEGDGAPDPTLEVGDLLSASPELAVDRDDDARDLDIGDLASDFAQYGETSCDDDDEGGFVGEDASVGISDVPAFGSDDDDGQADSDPSDSEIDERAFPELDSDDELDLPGGLDIGEDGFPDEPAAPEWADVRWERVSTPLVAVPMASVVVADSIVLAAGEGAVRLLADGQGTMTSDWIVADGLARGELISCCTSADRGGVVLLATARTLFRSCDGGRTIQAVAAPIATVSGAGLASVCLGSPDSGLVYVIRHDGALLASWDDAATWRVMDGIEAVGAVCSDERGSVQLLVRQPSGARLLGSDREGCWSSLKLNELPSEVDLRQAKLLAKRGSVIALGEASGRITVSWDAGETWITRRVPHTVCALAVVPKDLVVGAVYAESEDKSYLFRVTRAGTVELVADLSPDVAADGSQEADESEGLGQASALAWDNNRGVLWVAGRFGLVAWRPGFAS